MIERCLTEEAV
jgi:hypothetical protein